MDSRLIAVIDRLSEDLGNLEKALVHTQELLKELTREARKNGKIQKEQERRLDTIQATQRFLAGQQPRRDGTFRPLENDDSD